MDGKKSVPEGRRAGTKRPAKQGSGKRGLSLYPLSFGTAVAAALKTGTVPKADKTRKAAARDKA